MPTRPAMPLADCLRARIEAVGPLSFADWMEAALYDPTEGYYGAAKARLGRRGDFYTSVSVGPLYGRLLARQWAECWEGLGCPARWVIAEGGAHDGTLARDVLDALRDFAPDCLRATEYRLLEVSAPLRALQAERLAPYSATVSWPDAPPADWDPWEGLHFSNELLDAFPVHRVRWDGAGWWEQRVGLAGDAFCWTDAPLTDPALQAAVAVIPGPLPSGYRTEVRLGVAPWLRGLAAGLRRGWVWTVDYGFPRAEYYRPERPDGTLTGYAAHRRVADVLAAPGAADLTAHVDWTALAEAGREYGLTVAGFADQHHWLVALGAAHFATDPGTPKERRAFQTLQHPGLMGRAFGVLCLARRVPAEPPLTSFRYAPQGASRLWELSV